MNRATARNPVNKHYFVGTNFRPLIQQDIADELWERCAGVVPASLQDFLDRYPAKPKTQQLNLL
jgi:hypothetical protein